MTPEVVTQVPDIIENPVIVLKSLTQPDSIVAFAELWSEGKPVMVALNLTPIPAGGMEAEFSLIASAYGRSRKSAAGLIERSDVLYLDENKKRTDPWLMSLGLQLPSGQPVYGSIGSILYKGNFVNIQGIPWRELQNANTVPARDSPGEAGPDSFAAEVQRRLGVPDGLFPGL